MGKKLSLDGAEYEVADLSDQAKTILTSLNFANTRIQELTNLQALHQRAKKSYIESIKKEMLSSKAGLVLNDE